MTSRSGHSQHHPKLKAPTRALFSCGMFRNCTQTVLSPTKTAPPPPAATTTTMTTPPPSVPTATAAEPEGRHPLSSSSSSSSTSQSFTQWRFPLTHPPSESSDHRLHQESDFATSTDDLSGAFHVAELHLPSGNRIPALRLIERCLALDPGAAAVPCPLPVMAGVVASILDPAAARPAAKVLLALLLSESNRRLAVEAKAAPARWRPSQPLRRREQPGRRRRSGRWPRWSSYARSQREREGVRHRGSVGDLRRPMGWCRTAGGGPDVVMALQGDCTPRGRRKGAKLLKALKEAGRLDLPDDGC
ncbi:unnamed protein product [Spirodela intermedia]|uniref:Uncharacterized protein n=1 Tax=Spirodela intermedia TaxID=51605 RepID=A0A7I8J6Y2_SPIIN|nr:unnamed protein product [Spirodela intermedia]CAA6666008.1 unnamed protein product [Spirodela intermedia]